MDKVIPVTELRRNFGELTKNLAEIDSLLLTKEGRSFAILKAAPERKKEVLMRAAGRWKDTALAKGKIWKEVFKRKSRKASISL